MPKWQATSSLVMIEKLHKGQGQGKMLFIHFGNKAGTFSALAGEGNKGARSVIQERKGQTWRACWWEEVSVVRKQETSAVQTGVSRVSGPLGAFVRWRSSRLLGRSGVWLSQGREGEEHNLESWLYCSLELRQWTSLSSHTWQHQACKCHI